MRRLLTFIAALCLVSAMASPALHAQSKETPKPETEKAGLFKPEQQQSKGSVTIGGKVINYDAYAGTIVVHPKGWSDVPQGGEGDKDDKAPKPEASMFYVAYFKSGDAGPRPLTFLYNGGPGSSTVWLHMGAFGPRRVVTSDHSHTPAAPYSLINNEYSLLDASDLVFVDAPGTGFSRIAGKDAPKAFYGVDEDAYAFGDFIAQFLGKYGRWNSPKYIFGESYGTTRSGALSYVLETQRDIDLNGVILLSQILSYDNDGDSPQDNPGIDVIYQLLLPTYAATAWYHHKVPGSHPELQPFLKEVEDFAMTDYAMALAAGSELSTEKRQAIAEKLHEYTGLPVDYVLKADLRVNVGEFVKNLQDADDLTAGRLDTRFTGPTMDPLSKEGEYDPQSASISSAYVAAFNDYVRKELKFGEGREFKPGISVWQTWNYLHAPPGSHHPVPKAVNVMPDLAAAMKYNPNLKVMLNAGYFDLATPFYEGIYEMHHLPIPAKLQSNIEYKQYESGHMVYAHEDSLKAIHDNVAAFIRETDNIK